jgi:hypothetical protein
MIDTNALIDRLIRIKDGLTHRADRDAINEACAAFTDGSFYKESDIDAMQAKIAALEARVARLTVERNAADQNQWDIRSQAKIAALEAQIATLTAERDAARAGRVKPLEWEEMSGGFWRAPAPLFGSIRVEHYGESYEVVWSVPGYCDRFCKGEFLDEDAAKSAAQADYEARILAALENPE